MKHRTPRAQSVPRIARATPLNWALAAFMAITLGAGYLLDGPSEHQARMATAGTVQDGEVAETARLKSVAAQAHRQAVRAKKQAQELAQQTQTASAQ